MKEVVHRVKCDGVMHRVVVGKGGLSFPDHPDVWAEAQKLGLMSKLGGDIPLDQVKGGCKALAAYAKLGKNIIPTPKVGTAVIDILHKRAAMRQRLQDIAETPEPAEKLVARVRHEVLLTLRRCKYKHRVSNEDRVSIIVPPTAEEMFRSWITNGPTSRKWIATYSGEHWDVIVQAGWLTQVLSPGRAVVDGKFIAAVDPLDPSRVIAIYECTGKDPYPGAYLREARVNEGKLVWK